MTRLQNSRVLITGGAGGIGQALAVEFAAADCEVILADISPQELSRARARLSTQGVAAETLTLDVTSATAVESAHREVHARWGPIQVLVNNAGIVHGGPFLDVPIERHLATYRVNVEGVVLMTHAFLPDLLVADRGHLVNIASASGYIGLPFGSTYASSKWAVLGFSESIRQELQEQGHEHVGVTTVCPSYVDTGMFEGVKPPLLTRFLTPETLAEKVVDALRSNQSLVLEPWLVKMTPILAHALPGKLSDRLSQLFGAHQSMAHWTGHRPQGSDASEAALEEE